MKNKMIKKIILFLVVFALPLTFSTNAFSIPEKKSCTGPCVDGGYGGGASGQIPAGSGGTGPYSGRRGVMFGYEPDPSYTTCNNPDRALMARLRYPSNSNGPFYVHRLAAYSKDGNQTLLAGNENAQYWNTAWNSDTGLPTNQIVTDPAGAAGPSGNLFPPQWQLPRIHCIPLKGGGDIRKLLEINKPTLYFNGKSSQYLKDNNIVPKTILRMKSSTLTIDYNEGQLNQAGINLYLTIKQPQFFVCDINKRDKWSAENGNADPWLRFCYLGDSSESPIKFYTSSIDWAQKDADTKTAIIKVKYKRKGKFAIAAGATYEGRVQILTGTTTTSNQTAYSDPALIVNVVSVKSANRKS